MKRIGFVLLSITCLCFSCSDDNEEQVSTLCDNFVIIDSDVFQNRSDDDGTGRNSFEIINTEIENDCLSITIQSGGCNGDTWQVDLIDADRIAETAIPQRDLKVFLDNTELCNAITISTVSFELTPLRTDDDRITLNLEKWDTQLEYIY
ncbi:hypothetical protein SAMN05192540_3877 [Maribacter dokdonensis]|uniref:Uncharacterized protein n=1 Tax=Maribacter dokdonensis TaxID=320912 RepID=A0A1H4UR17_9FLAO|nr:hypothetical protein [Maribacter dokdonensis]SEC71195.1 hypothetical protein SAMN05192540_3877 [Maribacter dokdonensis]